MTTIDARLQPIITELLDNGITLPQALDVIEAKIIDSALVRCKNNQSAASRKLGIHRNTLINKLRTRRPSVKELKSRHRALLREADKVQVQMRTARRRS